MSRLQPVVDNLTGLEKPDDIMMELMEVLTEETILPEPGNYYTFVYSPKTLNITDDEYPLVAVTEVKGWGFKGFNYHWGLMRNYTWEEVIGKFHVVKANEIEDARSLSYANFKINS